jgi:hypothetical protein
MQVATLAIEKEIVERRFVNIGTAEERLYILVKEHVGRTHLHMASEFAHGVRVCLSSPSTPGLHLV